MGVSLENGSRNDDRAPTSPTGPICSQCIAPGDSFLPVLIPIIWLLGAKPLDSTSSTVPKTPRLPDHHRMFGVTGATAEAVGQRNHPGTVSQ